MLSQFTFQCQIFNDEICSKYIPMGWSLTLRTQRKYSATKHIWFHWYQGFIYPSSFPRMQIEDTAININYKQLQIHVTLICFRIWYHLKHRFCLPWKKRHCRIKPPFFISIIAVVIRNMVQLLLLINQEILDTLQLIITIYKEIHDKDKG